VELDCDFWLRPARASINAGNAINTDKTAMNAQILRLIGPNLLGCPQPGIFLNQRHYIGVLFRKQPGSVSRFL
jgi:hypothetical protein